MQNGPEFRGIQLPQLLQSEVESEKHDGSLHSDRLGQVSGLVDIRAPCASRVKRQQLQRHHVQDGTQLAIVLGHADDVQAGFAFDGGVAVGEDVELAAASADFLHVALELFQ